VARILIVGGGCRGRTLAAEMVAAGHAVRITTRTEGRRARIESVGAECWVGTPDRLATLRGVLDGVTIACWMLARAQGSSQEIAALHSSRLEAFLRQVIDTTVRGFVYDATAGMIDRELLAAGARITRSLTERNAIPARVMAPGAPVPGGPHEGRDGDAQWVAAGGDAVESLLGGSSAR
jgi:hypothetical protein